jgi:hypothetical protein
MMKLKLILAAFVFALAARAAVYDQITAVVGTTTQKVNVVVGSGSITNISGVRYLILDNSGNGGGGTWTAGGTITGNLTIAGALTVNGATTNNTTVNQITTINLGTNYVETISYTTNYTAQTIIVSTNTVTTNSVAQIVTIGGFIEAHQGSHVYTPHLYDTATGSLVASGSVNWTAATWVNPPTNGWTFGSANAVTNASGPGFTLSNGALTFSTNGWQFAVAEADPYFTSYTNTSPFLLLFTNRVDTITGGGTWTFATNTWTFAPATDESRAAAATQIGISLNGMTNYTTLAGGVISLGELAAVTGSVTHALTADSASTASTATFATTAGMASNVVNQPLFSLYAGARRIQPWSSSTRSGLPDMGYTQGLTTNDTVEGILAVSSSVTNNQTFAWTVVCFTGAGASNQYELSWAALGNTNQPAYTPVSTNWFVSGTNEVWTSIENTSAFNPTAGTTIWLRQRPLTTTATGTIHRVLVR